MDNSLIEHIESLDFNPKPVSKCFARSYGKIRGRRGNPDRSNYKKHLKKIAHKRVRQYFRSICNGRHGRFHPVTGWEVL